MQIYADFSGYTDIARGTSKLLGYELMENFRSPYRSLNVTEFWRRWHISLSTWFRDYLYTPLVAPVGVGSTRSQPIPRYGARRTVARAAWHFVLWGLFHGTLLVIHSICSPFLRAFNLKLNKTGKSLFKFGSWFLTFHLIVLSFVMFRSQSVADLGTCLKKMLLNPFADVAQSGFNFIPNAGLGEQVFYIALIASAVLMQFNNLEARFKWTGDTIVRGVRGAGALALIAILYPTVKEQFIYFQF